MRKILLYAFIMAIVAIPASITSFASHSWGGYHWERDANPVSLTLGVSLSSAWTASFDVAMADWNQSSVINLTDIPGSGKTRRCSPGSGVNIEVCNDTYGSNGWLGVAGVSVSGGHITEAYVKLNDTYFNTATYNTPEWRQLVMCQEIGHAFGLDHQDEDFNNNNLNTCMDYTSNPTSNQHPNNHDYQQLEDIYAHLDGGSGGGGGGGNGGCAPPPFCGARGSNNPSDWGQLVRQEGHSAVYVRDFGNGNFIVTFVFWADDQH